MVATPLRGYRSPVESQPFSTVGLRAWWAWNCLPRTDLGNLPKLRPLERAHDLSNGALRKVIWDEAKRPPSYDIAKRIAKALCCDPDWLFLAVGSGPKASWPVPARPARPESLGDDDLVGEEGVSKEADNLVSSSRN